MGANDWTEDELTVAFYHFAMLYMGSTDGPWPNPSRPDVQALCDLLPRRNGNAVKRKIENLMSVYKAWAVANGVPGAADLRDPSPNGSEGDRMALDAYMSRSPEERYKEFVEALARVRDIGQPAGGIQNLADHLRERRQIILYGPPGTGKTYAARQIAGAAAGDPSRVVVVQFHPGMSYEDFVEGLRPSLGEGGQVSYELTPGPLVRTAEKARKDPKNLYVMLIDEINRADLPKVLGELLYLLEYRDDEVNLTYRPEERFALPKNLLFIGTMNSADRSVALVDSALRRRFDFHPFIPGRGPLKDTLRNWLTERDLDTGIADLLDQVNEEISDKLGDHQRLGHSYFMTDDQSDSSLERIWNRNILPLLEEMFWGEEIEEAWSWESVQRRHRKAGMRHPAPDHGDGDEQDSADSE